MGTTETKSVRDIVTAALRLARVTGIGEAASAEDAETARDVLDMMLKDWQNDGYHLWAKASGTLTLTTAATYTLSPVRPLRILSARLKRGGIEMPMQELTRDEYDNLPQKASTGVPTTFHYDRQREAARLYVWPVLAAANGEEIAYTYEREVEDITSLNQEIDIPGEWWSAVVYGLASRMGDIVPVLNPNVVARAELLLAKAGAFDREESVYFR